MSNPYETKPSVFGARTAALLGGIFLGFFVLCAVLVGWDRVHRPQLESIAPQTSATHGSP